MIIFALCTQNSNIICVERIQVSQPKGKNRTRRNSLKNQSSNHSKDVSKVVLITFFVVSFILAMVSAITWTLIYKKCLRTKKNKICYTDAESGRPSSDSSRRTVVQNETLNTENSNVENTTRTLSSQFRYVQFK